MPVYGELLIFPESAIRHTQADEMGMLSPNALAFRNTLEFARGREAGAAAQLIPALDHYFKRR